MFLLGESWGGRRDVCPSASEVRLPLHQRFRLLGNKKKRVQNIPETYLCVPVAATLSDGSVRIVIGSPKAALKRAWLSRGRGTGSDGSVADSGPIVFEGNWT